MVFCHKLTTIDIGSKTPGQQVKVLRHWPVTRPCNELVKELSTRWRSTEKPKIWPHNLKMPEPIVTSQYDFVILSSHLFLWWAWFRAYVRFMSVEIYTQNSPKLFLWCHSSHWNTLILVQIILNVSTIVIRLMFHVWGLQLFQNLQRLAIDNRPRLLCMFVIFFYLVLFIFCLCDE